MKRLLLLPLLVFALFAGGMVHGAGLIIVTDPDAIIVPPRPPLPPMPPRPIPPPRPHVFAPLELASCKVDVRIRDQVAVTTVEQDFYNPNPRQLEGTFLFPVPKGAHINKFAMQIGGKSMEAELLDATKARKIYEDIVRSMKDPALLEFAGQDLYKVRIFPIEPHATKHVTLTYTQLLPSDSGLTTYHCPLGAGRYSAQPVKSLSVKMALETRLPLKTVYSPSHTLDVRREGDRRAVIGYEASNITPEGDLQLVFAADKDDIGMNLLTYRTAGEDGFFLLLASPGVDVDEKQVVPKDVVFVLDTSGSMAGNKLEQAKKALLFCVENLNKDDRFEVIRFSTESEGLFQGLSGVTRDNRSRATEFIKNLKPIGGTAIDDALQKALSLARQREHSLENNGLVPISVRRPFVVVFLTDGRPTVGRTDETQIVERVSGADASGARVFCFGIGTDVNTHLLDKITEKTRAFSQYVLPDEDIEVKVSTFFSKIKDPVLANPQIVFKGTVRATRLHPTPLPDLFKGGQLVLAGRYSGAGDGAIQLTGMLNGREHTFTWEGTFPKESGEHDFIPRLWATRRVGHLLDEIRLHGDSKELRDEVVELARTFNIVTPYTAYLIVEDEGRRNVPLAAQTQRRLQEDRSAREVAAANFERERSDRSGAAAVSSARSSLAFKSADNVDEALKRGAADAFYNLAATAPAAPPPASGGAATVAQPAMAEPAARLVGYTQQSRFVAGRSFYQSGTQWVDAQSQRLAHMTTVKIAFGSAEYFDLLKRHPEASAWLALGQNIRLVLDEKVYDIGG